METETSSSSSATVLDPAAIPQCWTQLPCHSVGPSCHAIVLDPVAMPQCWTQLPCHSAGPSCHATVLDPAAMPQCWTQLPCHSVGPSCHATVLGQLPCHSVGGGLASLSSLLVSSPGLCPPPTDLPSLASLPHLAYAHHQLTCATCRSTSSSCSRLRGAPGSRRCGSSRGSSRRASVRLGGWLGGNGGGCTPTTC